jgi:site-specific DNA-methyltransferase (adenine-specific)
MIGLKRFADGYFDLAICDVPYGINVGKMGYLTETKTLAVQKNGGKLNPNRNKKAYTLKEWDEKAPEQDYFDELRRVSKEQIIFGVEYVDWTDLGSGRIKWVKGIPEAMSFKSYELAYCSMIDNEVRLPLLWHGMRQAVSLKEPMVQQGNKKLNEKRIYPCHKPILLYQRLIADYAFAGAKIIDTHVGGGSSRIAANLAECEYIGFEIDEEYWLAQDRRFNEYKAQLRMF